MRKYFLLLLVPILLLSGCQRTGGTDVVLFCKAYNQTAETKIQEQDVLRRSKTEYILLTDGVMLRLKTENAAIHTVIVTAETQQTEACEAVARRAFAVLAEQAGESAPSLNFDSSNGQLQTDHFIYRLYRSSQSLTLMQLASQQYASPDQPLLRR